MGLWGGPSLADLTAAYGFGLARNHGYLDGNRRVAFIATCVFLGLNGYAIRQPEIVSVVIDVAAGDLSETDLAHWIEIVAEHRTAEGSTD